MKRKLLATLLALCLIVGMIPVAASANSTTDCPGGDTCPHAAAIGNTHYDTLQEAITAASPGQTIKLCNDIDSSQPIEVSKTLTLDLAGHKISNTSPIWDGSKKHWSLIRVANEGNLTLTGNGILEALQDDCYAVDLYDTDSNCTIEDGTFIGNVHAVYVFAGNLTVNGGTFSVKQKYSEEYPDEYVLNCYDDNYENETASITVNGGIFQGFNPQDCRAEGEGTDFCSDKCIVTSEEKDGITAYTVAPLTAENAVAQVDGGYYDSLQDAINAAERGETVVLLKDTTENVTIASGKDLQLDLNGKTLTETTYMDVQGFLTIKDRTATSAPQISSDYETVTYQSGKIANTGTGILVSNGGKLTLESGCVHSTSGNGINVNGNTNMEGWDNAIDSSVTITGGYVHSREYGIGVYGNGAVVNVEGGVVVADDNGAIAGNGSYNSDSNGDGVKDNYGGTEINIRGGTVIGHIVSPGYIAVGIYHPQNGELNISGGTIYADNGVGICIRNGSLNISENAQLYASGNEAGKVGDAANEIPGKTVVIDYSTGYNHGNETTDSRTVKIEGGYFSAEQNNIEVYTTEGNEIIDNFITGGYFTSDPSEYLVEGKVAVPSTVAGYSYTVADKEETSAEVSVAAPNVAKPVAEGTEGDRALANAVYSALTDSESTTTGPSIDESALKAAANAVANDTNGTVTDQIVEDLKQATSNENINANDVTIVIQPYLDIQITDVDATSGSETITLDVTPMYRTVATTANLSEVSDDEIILSGSGKEDTVNAVQIGTAQPLTVNNTVTVTIPLPEKFAQEADELFVRHVKSDNRVYFYTGSVEDNVLTFTNPNGFSEMTISKTNGAVAEIDGVGYATLTQALSEAQDGDTVTILEGGLTATMSGSERSITLKDGTNDDDSNSISLIINGQKIEIKDGETETFTYTPPTGGGTPEEPTWPFTDVTEGEDWFYDAVAYVYENGIMAGTDEATFEPFLELDRAMAAQLFYNLEGKPAVTGDSTFTDVTSGHWAVDAITWAAQNDIVAGIGGGLYDPDSNVTREQFAQMLYNYAKYKGYDLTATGDLTRFPDAGSISSWAETALSWANGNGLINGHENGTIDPKGSTIRAQAASIMANFDQNVAK